MDVGTQKNRHRDGSFEHPKHMLKLMGKLIITILCYNVIYFVDLSYFLQKSNIKEDQLVEMTN